MKITIDESAGFCPGVRKAIKKAESFLEDHNSLLCLGDIVHNPMEIKRLNDRGLLSVKHEKLKTTKNEVLIRSHGEPPSTYKMLEQNNLEYIDATCPIVKSLQKRIQEAYRKIKKQNGCIIIYGNKNHPEVIGLNGYCNNEAIIVSDVSEVDKINSGPPFQIFSQTTKNPDEYSKVVDAIRIKFEFNEAISYEDSICKWMKNRSDKVREFARSHDIVIFVAGKKSSNGRYLFSICKDENPDTIFVSSLEEVDCSWFAGKKNPGITGATSTPDWLLSQVASKIKNC